MSILKAFFYRKREVAREEAMENLKAQAEANLKKEALKASR